jgi:hypothetical protein
MSKYASVRRRSKEGAAEIMINYRPSCRQASSYKKAKARDLIVRRRGPLSAGNASRGIAVFRAGYGNMSFRAETP